MTEPVKPEQKVDDATLTMKQMQEKQREQANEVKQKQMETIEGANEQRVERVNEISDQLRQGPTIPKQDVRGEQNAIEQPQVQGEQRVESMANQKPQLPAMNQEKPLDNNGPVNQGTQPISQQPNQEEALGDNAIEQERRNIWNLWGLFGSEPKKTETEKHVQNSDKGDLASAEKLEDIAATRPDNTEKINENKSQTEMGGQNPENKNNQ